MSTAVTTSIRQGDIIEYGQKNISKSQRNLLNADEILRLPANKLMVILRGNKPLLLDKMRYTEHPLACKLKDSSIYDYKPNWSKNTKIENGTKKNVSETKKRKIGFDNF